MSLDRRRFLQLSAAGMAAGLLDSACTRDDVADGRALATPDLLEMLGPERARAIGIQYRAAVPRENSTAALRDAISSGQRGFPWIWRRSIEDQVRDDFAAGRVIVVSGWVLSETEARQCALYSLSA